MDFGGLLILGLVWLFFNLIGQAKGKPRTGSRGPTPQPRPPGSVDPTQQEGSRLERLLRELERNLEQVADGQSGGAPRLPRPQRPATAASDAPKTVEAEEDIEERGSLEEPEQIVNLEADVSRGPRTIYDQDAEAEAIVQRRIEAARTRDRALSKKDHSSFDARIRQEPADHTAVRRYTPAQLRDAIVWREILGKPVSERE